MKWLVIALACCGCDATFDYKDPTDASLDSAESAVGTCAHEEDCPQIGSSKLHCDVESGRCLECLNDEQCPRRCDLGTHTCVECNDKSQCPPLTVCVNHRCMPDCDKSGCLFGEKCVGGICIHCDEDRDCKLGTKPQPPHCSLGQCVQCVSNSNCPPIGKSRCLPGENRCVECLDSTDCKDALCDPDGHTCVKL